MSKIIEQAKYTCALGAQQSVLAIPRAIPIIHAGPGCSSRQFAFVSNGAGYQGEGYAGGGQIPSTNSSQSEVVFGGEKKLADTIEGAKKVIDGDLYVVLSGCTAGIVGDDVKQVAAEAYEDDKPVVGVDTAGFRGNNYKGHEIVLEGILNQFIYIDFPKANVRKGLVNVFSVVPYQNPFWRGDLEEIKRLLESIGLEVNILFGYESAGVSEWKDIPNAQFNLLISPWVGLNAVKSLEKKYGTPYLHIPTLPIGLKNTSSFLRTVGEFAKVDKEKVEEVVAYEEKKYKQYFVAFGDLLADFASYLPYHLYVANDSLYGLAFADFLSNELGITPKLFAITDEPDNKSKDFVIDTLVTKNAEWDGKVITEGDNRVIQDLIYQIIKKEDTKSLIIGSSWDNELAFETDSILIKAGMPISDRVIINKSYVGYKGGLTLIEEIYSGLFEKGMITNTTHADKDLKEKTCPNA